MLAVRQALRDGCTHVVEADIQQCFASIDHARLWNRLDQVLLLGDRRLRTLLARFLAQPYVLGGEQHARGLGLAQGAPLSPLLCNLFLTPLDLAMAALGVHHVRYADDFVVLTRGKGAAQLALARAQEVLAELGLTLAPAKTRIVHVQQGFDFLGERFDDHSGEPQEAAVAAQRKPLLVTEPYLMLGVNGGGLEARRAGKLLGVWPMRRLSGLVVMSRCTFSTALLERCSALDISIAVALNGGKQISVLAPNQRHFHQVQHLHATWYEAQTPPARLGLAQAVVQAKLHNQATLVAQREPRSELVETLKEARRLAAACTTTDALRGHEGHAARLVFAWLQHQLLPSVRPVFTARRRERGAPDRLNSLLNFCYYLLFTRVNAMLRLRGLNPYLGWLHDGDDDYETLVYDLMEPFRPLVDRLVLRLLNRQELRASHFEQQDGQHWLSRSALVRVAEAFERALGERVGRYALRDLMWMQVRAVNEFVLGRGPVWLFHWEPRGKPPPADVTVEPSLWVVGDLIASGEIDEEAGPRRHRRSMDGAPEDPHAPR